MPNISEVDQAWKEIEDAGRRGNFVPVLGFELSSLPEYNQVPINVRKTFGKSSPQIQGLLLQNAKIDYLSRQLSEKEKGAKKYLQGFKHSFTGPEKYQPTGGLEPAYSMLQVNLARLAFELTRRWGECIYGEPRPLGAAYTEMVASPDIVDDEPYLRMRQCLNCCAQLWNFIEELPEEKKKDILPNSLQINWVYEKLLRFASEIFVPKKLWDGLDPCKEEKNCCGQTGAEEFKGKHLQFITYRLEETNWKRNFDVLRQRPGGAGIRLSNLLWLQSLIRYLLLSSTRTYRTRNELSFLLSLNDKIQHLPDSALDPYEINLLNPHTELDEANLKDILTYCEGNNLGDRVPQPFYWALARFLRQKRKVGASDSRRQVILSMCLDREMERAISREFGAFRVALPIYMPLFGGAQKQSWIIAECERSDAPGRPGYSVSRWVSVEEDAIVDRSVLDYDGPLLVKLFGSPLEELPPCSSPDLKFHSLAPEGSFTHRLVLDESELLSSLFHLVPENYGDLRTFLGKCQLFFFGQDVIRWSERIPYYMVRTFSGDSTEANPFQLEDFKPIDDRFGAVSFVKPDAIGATALKKLNIRYASNTAETEAVIKRFIEEVSRGDK